MTRETSYPVCPRCQGQKLIACVVHDKEAPEGKRTLKNHDGSDVKKVCPSCQGSGERRLSRK